MSGVRRDAGSVGGNLRLGSGEPGAAHHGARRNLHRRGNCPESVAQAEKRKIRRRREAQGKARILPGADSHPRGVERGVPAAGRRLGSLEKSLGSGGRCGSISTQLRHRSAKSGKNKSTSTRRSSSFAISFASCSALKRTGVPIVTST